jgi:DNA polymerase-3 subunit alpha
MTDQQQLFDYFLFRCEKGMKQRGLAGIPEYEERLTYEQGVIRDMDFVGYMLLVSDIVTWCIEKGIVVGPGRGSSAGSIVAYILQITHLDPLKYGLIFERFLNPNRVSMCDVDLDFQDDRRDEIIQYLQDKFGEKNVSHIGTFGTMQAKAALRDVTRTLGYEYEVGDRLAKLTLPAVSGKPQPLSLSCEKVPELAAYREAQDSPEGKILYWAEKFEGRIRSFSTHASGVVISDNPIWERIPLYPGKDKKPTTQFEMNTVEDAGLIKFDILGLKTLSTINRCISLIRSNHGINIDPLEIPKDDEETYNQISEGDVDGVFQLEGSSGLQDLALNLKPRCLEDLSLLVALYRPGPIALGMLDEVIAVRDGEAQANYLIPDLKPILEETAGCLVYQEQVLQICRDLAGYSMAEADLMRRAIGKKKQKEMDAQKTAFINGMVDNGYRKEDAEKLFAQIEGFASYSFNRAHSACYGHISCQTAYLKHYYPAEFLCSCLTTDSGEQEKVVKYIDYCKKKGIEVLPPDINESIDHFTANKKGQIRFGLSAVKNLGDPPVAAILLARETGPFENIIDFCNRVNLSIINKKKLKSLILSGAFDSTDRGRATLLEAIEDIFRYRKERKTYESKVRTYTKRMNRYEAREGERRKGSKKPSLKVPTEPEKPCEPRILESINKLSTLDKLMYEKELLGFYLSGHPVSLVGNQRGDPISDILEEGVNKQKVSIIAVVSLLKEITTRKKKEKMAFLTLEDETASIQVVCFPKTWEKYKELITGRNPLKYTLELEVIGSGDGNTMVKGRVVSARKVQYRKEATHTDSNYIDVEIPFARVDELIQILRDKKGDQKVGINLTLEGKSGNKISMKVKHEGNVALIRRSLEAM